MRGVPKNLPDVSLVGDISAKLTADTSDFYRNRITIREIEFALQGYLYPEMRADAFFAFHRHGDHVEAEICEGYVSFLNLFGGFGLIVGKKHTDFGKVNKLHQHHVPYTDRPVVLTNFFGEHGLVGEGASLDYLLHLPVFLQLTIGAWRAESAAHHDEHEEAEKQFSLADEFYTARAWASFPVGMAAELEIGGSGAVGQGAHHEEHKDDVRVMGLDATLKAWPSTYQRLILQGELLQLTRELPGDELTRWGFYTFLGYRFTRYWDAGLRYDWTENALPEREQTQKISAMVTNHLTETTKLRIQYGYCCDEQEHEAVIQLIFGIGPHSHPLE
ncbi:MAG: hypothetical protein JSW54_03760 [Fidelibacterota bacterium]|nr:MAG: hypothetical protein JSW54_03760 [Candidatus Neomarinimicrobiota bacterium]